MRRPTPIQAESIPPLLQGRDLLGEDLTWKVERAIGRHSPAEVNAVLETVRQVAGDTVGVVNSSLVSAQYPDRGAVATELAAIKGLPSIEDLDKLRILLFEEMAASSRVVKFPTTIRTADGNTAEAEVGRAYEDVRITELQLAQLASGSRSEDIDAARAQVQQAQGHLATAQAELVGPLKYAGFFMVIGLLGLLAHGVEGVLDGGALQRCQRLVIAQIRERPRRGVPDLEDGALVLEDLDDLRGLLVGLQQQGVAQLVGDRQDRKSVV